MNIFTLAWIVWLVWFAGWEIYAIIRKRPGDTFSEHVWRWLRVRDERPTTVTWLIRGGVLAFGTWLTLHMAFGWFSPLEGRGVE